MPGYVYIPVTLCISQFQLRLPPSPRPLRATARHLLPLSVPGVGHLQILCCRGPGICQPRGLSWAFVTHAVSYQNITTPMILLTERKQIGSSVMDRKNWRGCKGMFLILCMHFLHCLLSQNYIAKSGAIDVNQRFLVIESNLLFIKYNFTALY